MKIPLFPLVSLFTFLLAVPGSLPGQPSNESEAEPPPGEKAATLAGKPARLAGKGMQFDLPAAVATGDGVAYVASVVWNGESDSLRLFADGGEGFEKVVTLVEEGIVHEPALTRDRDGRFWCAWGATGEDETVDLMVRSWHPNEGPGEVAILSDTDAAEAFVDAGVDSEGRVWMAWQSFRNGQADVLARFFDPGTGEWSAEIVVADTPGGEWEPDLAFDGDGHAWVLYDRARDNDFDLQLARVDASGGVKVFDVAATDHYEARGSLVEKADGSGFWIAGERGKKRWGLDARGHKDRTGINAGKTVLFGSFDLTSETFREIPLGPAGLAGGSGPVNVPVVGLGADGTPRVAYRYFDEVHWKVALTAWRPDTGTWTSRRRIAGSSYGQDRRAIFLPAAEDGDCRILWTSDGRERKAHGELAIHLATLASPDDLPDAKPPGGGEGQSDDGGYPPSQDTPERPADDRHRWRVGGTDYGLYWGDFHRHTDVSNCRTGFDGCVVDHFRYAYDLAKIDFLGTSDHTDIGKIYHPYEWWHNQRLHDALHSPGRFNTLYVYEREQRWPWGHRNVIFAQRGGPIVYIKRNHYRASPWQSVFPVKAGLNEIDPYELWDILEDYGKPVAVISHTGATGMGTDWAKYDRIGYASENVVEIYQGARVSYEGEGAPQPTVGLAPGEDYTINGDADAEPPAPILDFGKFSSGTYQSALELGHRLGVFASSDHISQHASYGGIYCEEFTREGVIEAIDARRTIAATDKIHLNFTCNDRPLGSIFESDEPARLWFQVDGTAPLRRVTIVRNEEDWKEFENIGAADLEETVVDEAMAEGENRYYIRVEQEDGNMAWSSPVWVTRGQ